MIMNIMSNKLLSKMEDPNKLNISMGAVFPTSVHGVSDNLSKRTI